MDILKKVRNTIEKYNLLSSGERVLVALSGGSDSVALLRVLLALAPEYNLTVSCAHINHSLRETAGRDARFCEDLAKELGVEFFLKTVDVSTQAKIAGEGVELYARRVRYEFFDSLGYDKIATAHNKNDVAETMLFNFIRGASTGGMSGIPPVRGNIIRPLLDVTKSEINAFCGENGYSYVTDETNFEPIYSRNKIRLKLIPDIERELNPAFVSVVTKNAELIREDAEFLDGIAKKEYTEKTERLKELEMPIRRRVIQLHYQKAAGTVLNLPSGYVDEILKLCAKNHTGGQIHLPGGFSAKISYGRLIIDRHTEKTEYEYKIYPDKVLNIPETGKNVCIKKTEGKGDVYLDSETKLTVRSRLPGDCFCPVGMKGTKKLSDFFTDKKIPVKERDKIPVILAGDTIMAVGNLRYDRRFSDKTKQAYKIVITEENDAR